jgi:hypothetical protein
MKRRHFLQAAGSTLATLGLSHLDFLTQAQHYNQVLAQTTPRKLALLIGINDYIGVNPLFGCLTDTELQYELLRHRYGFQPADILVLTNAQATRQGILTAFKEHLIDKAKPGDVVVFHFSGHGWMVQDPDPNPGFIYQNRGVNGTLIPFDWNQGESGKVRNIMGHTLFLLMSALQTENVTAILDSCHSGGGLRGNTVVRSFLSRTGGDLAQPTQEELDYQNQWLSDPRLNLNPQTFAQRRKAGIAKGIGIGSASLQQEALDARFNGFNAGAFTYLLTRYLWQLPVEQPVATLFTNLALSTQTYALDQTYGRQPQDPVKEAKPGNQQQPLFFTSSRQFAAEAVVRATPKPGEPIKFWLSGVSPNSLSAAGSIFTIIDRQGKAIGAIEQTGRNGLEATGKLLPNKATGKLLPDNVQITEGIFLREQIRGIPNDLSLKIGLDPSLGNALPIVQKALAGLQRIELIPVAQKQDVQYILGRVGETAVQNLKQQGIQPLPLATGICLFTPTMTPLSESFIATEESIEAAIQRLRPRFKSLLAGRILQSLLGNTSPLKVSADVFPVDPDSKPIGTARTIHSRGLQEASIKSKSIMNSPLKAGSEVMIRVKNSESIALYMAVLVIADTGELGVLYPFGYESPIDAALVPAKSEKLVPVPFIVQGAQGQTGFFELMILASREPLRDALLALRDIARSRGVTRGEPAGLQDDEPVKVATDLLGGIDQMSRTGLTISPRVRAVDIGKLAVLSAVMQVEK